MNKPRRYKTEKYHLALQILLDKMSRGEINPRENIKPNKDEPN